LLGATPIDLLRELDATAIGRPEPKIDQKTVRPARATDTYVVSEKRLEAWIRSILAGLKQAAQTDGQKHKSLRNFAITLGGGQLRAGFSDDQGVQWLLDQLPDTVEDWELAARTARDGLAYGRNRPIDFPDRPEFRPKILPTSNGGGNGTKHPPGEPPLGNDPPPPDEPQRAPGPEEPAPDFGWPHPFYADQAGIWFQPKVTRGGDENTTPI
jgi:hypothetical protein